jgi:hypothetical protein
MRRFDTNAPSDGLHSSNARDKVSQKSEDSESVPRLSTKTTMNAPRSVSNPPFYEKVGRGDSV